MMGESMGSNNQLALANESKHHEIISTSPPIVCDLGESSMDHMEINSIAESIEKSKSHWSQVQEFDSTHEVAEVSNVEFFQTLQKDPNWGSFFVTFGEGEHSCGKLVMGKKFAEGGQAKLYDVQIKWCDPKVIEFAEKQKIEYVLKVFKKGTFLRHLQSQWPQGMLQHHVVQVKRVKLGLPLPIIFYSDVYCTTLLEDGRFAFVMVKEEKDLRSLIDELMLIRPKNKGPFSKDEVELIMYRIALGMDQLHSQGIVHRDMKASNVLRTSTGNSVVADYECSVGVMGTRFWRAPEILEACKYRNVNEKVELFTKAVDVYGYGMTCYEILTGKLPFEGHPQNKYDFVLEGQRPELPEDVDDWIRKLLQRCWDKNPLARPSFGEILKVFVTNSRGCRQLKLALERQEVESGLRKESKLEKFRRSLRIVKLKLMGWIGGNLLVRLFNYLEVE